MGGGILEDVMSALNNLQYDIENKGALALHAEQEPSYEDYLNTVFKRGGTKKRKK